MRRPTTWREVYPGQDWRFPDGEVWHVAGIVWDGTERHVLCTCADGGVLHIPAQTLVAQATVIFPPPPSPGPLQGET